tara:strand:+ start:171 stop:650 length:480 start_codon:yes stop_codon:yes gene_type:complete
VNGLSYSDIGVRTFIYCCGTRTIHSGTLMLPCVREAIIEASKAFVNMDELMERIQRLPQLDGDRDRVVMWETGRFTYDQAIRAVGAAIVTVADEAGMQVAIKDSRTAMVALLGTDTLSPVVVARVAEMAKDRDIPVLVDVASERIRICMRVCRWLHIAE